MFSKLLNLYKVLRFLATHLTVDNQGFFKLQGQNFVISASADGLRLQTDEILRVNGKYFLQQCSEDFDVEEYVQQAEIEATQKRQPLSKCAPCRLHTQQQDVGVERPDVRSVETTVGGTSANA